MKTLCGLLLFSALSVSAQVGTATSPRTLTRKVAPPPPAPARPAANPNITAPVATVPAAPASKAQQASTAGKVSAEEAKKVQWQKERAEAGSASVQYDLGLRYLEGKGVEKDPALAKKWLKKSADQGNAKAKEKLAELESAK